MITIDNKFKIGEIVYLKTDKEQLPRIIYGFIVTKSECLYKVCCGTATSEHYDYEISIEKDILMELS